jgi:hypothetical protein
MFPFHYCLLGFFYLTFFQLVPKDWPKNPDLDKWQFSFNLVT